MDRGIIEESETGSGVSLGAGIERMLPRIKTKEDGPIMVNLESLDKTWKDEPMTPIGRLFTEMNPIFVCVCVLGFKYPIHRQRFKSQLESTLLKHKRFASRVEIRKGKPWWTQVNTNVEDHVFEAELTPEQREDGDGVMNYVAVVVIPRPFDTSKPLWDVHILDAKVGEAEGCCIFRIHHALGDGTSLMSLLMACTRMVDNPDMLPAVTNNPTLVSEANSHSCSSRVGSFATRSCLVPWYSVTEIGRAVAALLWRKDSSTLITGYAGLERSPRKCRFVTFRMDEMKSVSKVMGATVNDVFLAMCAFGFRRYLEHHARKGTKRLNQIPVDINKTTVKGEKIPSTVVEGSVEGSDVTDRLTRKLDRSRIRAAVMINTRAAHELPELSQMMNGNASQAPWGNHMGVLIIPIPMKLNTDPLKLVRQAQATGTRKKTSCEGPFSWAGGAISMKMFGKKAATAIMSRIVLHTTLSLSNVRGPSEPVEFAGNPIVHVIPSVTGHPHALTLLLHSYNGEVALVAMTAKELIPDPELLLQLCLDGLQEMKTLAARQVGANRFRG